WKEYKKGTKYLKKYGLWVFIKMPPGGKTEFIQAKAGFAFENKEKELLSKPYTVTASTGKMIKLSREFMDRFQLITKFDLERIIRNSSIILTDFSGPKTDDIMKNHMERLQKWKTDDKPFKQQEFVGSLMMLENLQGAKDLLPNAHYSEAATILGHMFKLW
ncbi:MAG: hypothetical protein ACTSPM_03250, partial [Candidatus Heimdallarchaeota archaeon]